MAKKSDARQEKYESKRAGTRTRNWNFIVYPESAPSDWIEIVKSENVPFAVSPLHDSDVLENETGELKKAHYHVVITYSSVKTYNQVKELTDKLNAPIPQQCKSLIGSVRYLIHLDNADKFQYNKSEIQCFNGFDLDKFIVITATDRYELIGQMMEFIIEQDIVEFSRLFLYARKHNEDWYKLLCDNSCYVLGQFIKSRRHQTEESREKEKLEYFGE